MEVASVVAFPADAGPRHPLTHAVGPSSAAAAGLYPGRNAARPALPHTTTIGSSTLNMQLMSTGLRAQVGRALHKPPGNVPSQSARSIHMPSWIQPRPPPRSAGTSTGTFFRQARSFLTRVVGELTAPGSVKFASHVPHTSGPAYSANPYRLQTIQQRLNGPTRFMLSRPLGAPFVPRAPTVPRNITHVGLGTARNFSSARPLFQNIAENVPIAGRAFWEADWDIKLQQEKERLRPKKYSGGRKSRPSKKQVLPPIRNQVTTATTADSVAVDELDHYFPALAAPEVTTYLLVPLAPTPTSRLPLPTSPSVHISNHPLIPFSYLSSVHDDHATHALRVSSLFARLDTAKVFEEPNVTCSAFGHASGLCTVLEIKFAGWTEARVRGVIGEAGTGWCVLEEIHEGEAAVIDDALSEMSLDTGASLNSPTHPDTLAIDPSTSFVLPTLDFSASFTSEAGSWARAQSPVSTPISDLQFHNVWSSVHSDSGLDNFSDISESMSLDSGSDWGSPFVPFRSRQPSLGSQSNGWTPLGFSSVFSSRMQQSDVEAPPELTF